MLNRIFRSSFLHTHSLSVALLLVSCLGSESAFSQHTAIPEATDSWLATVENDISMREYELTQVQDACVKENQSNDLWQASNRAHDFSLFFTKSGPRVIRQSKNETSEWIWGLELLHAPALEEINAEGTRLEYLREGGFTEWYVNNSKGLEQGFTLSQPGNGDTVTLSLGVQGNLIPKMMFDGETIKFQSEDGVDVLHYSQLKAWDATGRVLSSNMEVDSSSSTIQIYVNTNGAQYPVTIDPLTTASDWSVENDQYGSGFGVAVSSAGDVNHDGFDDVIVGASLYSHSELEEGAAFVYLGSATGLSTSASWMAESNQEHSYFGARVSSAGDVNGDGYDDIIVGGTEIFNSQGKAVGGAYVYYGSPLGVLNSPAWVAKGNEEDADFGISVSSAGDVNGDGYGDVIVGQRYYTNGQEHEGRVYVYHGSSSGLSTTAVWVVESNMENARFGISSSTAGDVNGDGYDDIIVGAYTYSSEGGTDSGAAFVYYGSSSGLSTTSAWMVESDQVNASYGFCVANAGDINADGYSDIVVGSSRYLGKGAAFIYHGSNMGLSTTASRIVTGDQVNANFGSSVSKAGDINGDGYDDLVVGASDYENPFRDQGRVYFFQGSPWGLNPNAIRILDGDQRSAFFGRSVSTAGDVNGDGYADVIVGASGLATAYTYMGSNTADGILDCLLAHIEAKSDMDLNLDGIIDVSDLMIYY
jgi:FG-GAP repeat/FG-GAP-like repeat